jgi:hypothetical protein
MTTPPQDPAGDDPARTYDDRTRDIRLPSLPDRPPAAVPPEWQAHLRPAPVEQPRPAEESTPGGTAAVSAALPPEPVPPRPYVLPNEPTDELSSPHQVRQQTIAFDAPAAGAPAAGAAPVTGRPAPAQDPPRLGRPPSRPPSTAAPGPGTPSYGPPPSSGPPERGIKPDRTRRWPWVVLAVLPVLVIVVAGLLLVFLLRAAG